MPSIADFINIAQDLASAVDAAEVPEIQNARSPSPSPPPPQRRQTQRPLEENGVVNCDVSWIFREIGASTLRLSNPVENPLWTSHPSSRAILASARQSSSTIRAMADAADASATRAIDDGTDASSPSLAWSAPIGVNAPAAPAPDEAAAAAAIAAQMEPPLVYDVESYLDEQFRTSPANERGLTAVVMTAAYRMIRADAPFFGSVLNDNFMTSSAQIQGVLDLVGRARDSPQPRGPLNSFLYELFVMGRTTRSLVKYFEEEALRRMIDYLDQRYSESAEFEALTRNFSGRGLQAAAFLSALVKTVLDGIQRRVSLAADVQISRLEKIVVVFARTGRVPILGSTNNDDRGVPAELSRVDQQLFEEFTRLERIAQDMTPRPKEFNLVYMSNPEVDVCGAPHFLAPRIQMVGGKTPTPNYPSTAPKKPGPAQYSAADNWGYQVLGGLDIFGNAIDAQRSAAAFKTYINTGQTVARAYKEVYTSFPDRIRLQPMDFKRRTDIVKQVTDHPSDSKSDDAYSLRSIDEVQRVYKAKINEFSQWIAFEPSKLGRSSAALHEPSAVAYRLAELDRLADTIVTLLYINLDAFNTTKAGQTGGNQAAAAAAAAKADDPPQEVAPETEQDYASRLHSFYFSSSFGGSKSIGRLTDNFYTLKQINQDKVLSEKPILSTSLKDKSDETAMDAAPKLLAASTAVQLAGLRFRHALKCEMNVATLTPTVAKTDAPTASTLDAAINAVADNGGGFTGYLMPEYNAANGNFDFTGLPTAGSPRVYSLDPTSAAKGIGVPAGPTDGRGSQQVFGEAKQFIDAHTALCNLFAPEREQIVTSTHQLTGKTSTFSVLSPAGVVLSKLEERILAWNKGNIGYKPPLGTSSTPELPQDRPLVVEGIDTEIDSIVANISDELRRRWRHVTFDAATNEWVANPDEDDGDENLPIHDGESEKDRADAYVDLRKQKLQLEWNRDQRFATSDAASIDAAIDEIDNRLDALKGVVQNHRKWQVVDYFFDNNAIYKKLVDLVNTKHDEMAAKRRKQKDEAEKAARFAGTPVQVVDPITSEAKGIVVRQVIHTHVMVRATQRGISFVEYLETKSEYDFTEDKIIQLQNQVAALEEKKKQESGWFTAEGNQASLVWATRTLEDLKHGERRQYLRKEKDKRLVILKKVPSALSSASEVRGANATKQRVAPTSAEVKKARIKAFVAAVQKAGYVDARESSDTERPKAEVRNIEILAMQERANRFQSEADGKIYGPDRIAMIVHLTRMITKIMSGYDVIDPADKVKYSDNDLLVRMAAVQEAAFEILQLVQNSGYYDDLLHHYAYVAAERNRSTVGLAKEKHVQAAYAARLSDVRKGIAIVENVGLFNLDLYLVYRHKRSLFRKLWDTVHRWTTRIDQQYETRVTMNVNEFLDQQAAIKANMSAFLDRILATKLNKNERVRMLWTQMIASYKEGRLSFADINRWVKRLTPWRLGETRPELSLTPDQFQLFLDFRDDVYTYMDWQRRLDAKASEVRTNFVYWDERLNAVAPGQKKVDTELHGKLFFFDSESTDPNPPLKYENFENINEYLTARLRGEKNPEEIAALELVLQNMDPFEDAENSTLYARPTIRAIESGDTWGQSREYAEFVDRVLDVPYLPSTVSTEEFKFASFGNSVNLRERSKQRVDRTYEGDDAKQFYDTYSNLEYANLADADASSGGDPMAQDASDSGQKDQTAIRSSRFLGPEALFGELDGYDELDTQTNQRTRQASDFVGLLAQEGVAFEDDRNALIIDNSKYAAATPKRGAAKATAKEMESAQRLLVLQSDVKAAVDAAIITPSWDKKSGWTDLPAAVVDVGGGDLMLRRDVLKATGPLVAHFFLHGDLLNYLYAQMRVTWDGAREVQRPGIEADGKYRILKWEITLPPSMTLDIRETAEYAKAAVREKLEKDLQKLGGRSNDVERLRLQQKAAKEQRRLDVFYEASIYSADDPPDLKLGDDDEDEDQDQDQDDVANSLRWQAHYVEQPDLTKIPLGSQEWDAWLSTWTEEWLELSENQGMKRPLLKPAANIGGGRLGDDARWNFMNQYNAEILDGVNNSLGSLRQPFANVAEMLDGLKEESMEKLQLDFIDVMNAKYFAVERALQGLAAPPPMEDARRVPDPSDDPTPYVMPPTPAPNNHLATVTIDDADDGLFG